MKFHVAWAKVAAQNVSLKFVVICLCVVTLILGIVNVKVSLKEPLIIDRACYSKAVNSSDNIPNTTETENFLKEAIAMRFNSDATPLPGFLSISEEQFREQEQKEFKQKQMIQKVAINSITQSDSKVILNTDRLISVAQIRSAFIFPLIVTLGRVPRTESNPYGLILEKVSPPETKQNTAPAQNK
jgi:hypothetical protein